MKALAAYVDELFVMAYDMQEPGVASATAPLTNASLNDAMTLGRVRLGRARANRIVLGIPLYGYDFPASSRYDGAGTTGLRWRHVRIDRGRRPTARLGPGDRDCLHGVRRAGKWHQTWFDDPVSMALKTALGGPVRLRRRRRLGARDVGRRPRDHRRAARRESGG